MIYTCVSVTRGILLTLTDSQKLVSGTISTLFLFFFFSLDKNYTQESSPNADGPSSKNGVVLLSRQKNKKPKQGIILYHFILRDLISIIGPWNTYAGNLSTISSLLLMQNHGIGLTVFVTKLM